MPYHWLPESLVAFVTALSPSRRRSPTRVLTDRLRQHRPVPVAIVRRRLALRWIVTIGMLLLLPLSVFSATVSHSLSAAALAGISTIGLLAVVISLLARRKHGLNRSWGLAALTDAEAAEVAELSARHAAVSAIVDDWLHRWVQSGSVLRCNDLLLLRQAMRRYEKATAGRRRR